MASIVNKIKLWLSSPQGRQARARAEQMARDPHTRAKVKGLLNRRNQRRH